MISKACTLEYVLIYYTQVHAYKNEVGILHRSSFSCDLIMRGIYMHAFIYECMPTCTYIYIYVCMPEQIIPMLNPDGVVVGNYRYEQKRPVHCCAVLCCCLSFSSRLLVLSLLPSFYLFHLFLSLPLSLLKSNRLSSSISSFLHVGKSNVSLFFHILIFFAHMHFFCFQL